MIGTSNASITFERLIPRFDAWLARRVELGMLKPATRTYYAHQLRGLTGDLEDVPGLGRATWHRIQALKRLLHWARKPAGLIESLPLWVEDLPSAPLGQRTSVFSRRDQVRLLRAAAPDFRQVLMFLRGTMCRPGEGRQLQWEQERLGFFELLEFKSRGRRRDGVNRRLLVPDARTARLIRRLRERRGAAAAPWVFLRANGRIWTKDAMVQRMRSLRRRLKLTGVVCYTWRHTGATTAAARGVNTLLLSRFLGHSKVTTTERYFHPSLNDLAGVHDFVARPARRQAASKPGGPDAEREIRKLA